MNTERKKYIAVYQRIKDDILQGVLAPGGRLPSKRALADQLGVSVVTVEAAYRQLIDEGYAYARERSGYYVERIDGIRPAAGAEHPPLRLLLEEEPAARDDLYFPYSVWFRTLRRVMSEYGPRLVERSPGKGCARLRNAIAAYLLRYRGMYAPPERIVVGSGAEQLYEAVVRMLGVGRIYGIESPSYRQIEAVYAGSGALVDHLPIGPDGIAGDALAATEADVLHVTPFHSWPTGATAPAAKRYEYLSWVRQDPRRCIVEDDFDSEFFLPGKPLETLYSMDREGRVIYINTFSRSLAPSMRLGYMIVPEPYLPLYDEKLGRYSCSVPLLEQYALAEFLDDGSFEQHLSRKRRRLAERGAR